MPFSPEWSAVKELVGRMQKDYISYDDYINLCISNSIISKLQQKTLLGFLHDLGLLLHFNSLKNYDTHVMNPLWLTNGVYRIINSRKVVENSGVLKAGEIVEIINDNSKDELQKFYYPRRLNAFS